VYGQVDVSAQKRVVDVFDETRFVLDSRLRLYRDELGFFSGRLDCLRNRPCLPEGKCASARSDPNQRLFTLRRIGVTRDCSLGGTAFGLRSPAAPNADDSASSPNSSRNAWM
jgi:hypothetical protein